MPVIRTGLTRLNPGKHVRLFSKVGRNVMKIGYVGLGAMGGALAKWLIVDHDLQVWDLNPDAMKRLVDLGARAATSLPQMARDCDVVILCLPRSKNVETAIFGENGLAEGLSAGKVVVDQTSGVASETQAMAEKLAAMGVAMIDAPVAGGVPSAVGGTITIMLSGPDDAQAMAMPAFKAMTSKIYRASNQAGDAQSVKTLNNMMNMVFRVATLEFTALAVKLGAALPALTETFKSGVAGNFTCRTVLPAIIEGRSTGDFALTLMLKDNNQALNLGMAAQVPMPFSSLARGVLQQNINVTGPAANLDDVITFMEQVTGVAFAEATPKDDADHVTVLVETALAGCNRAIAYEILSLAAKMGMALADFGEIVNNGSAWSRECETVLAELAGTSPAPDRTIGQTVAALQELEALNLGLGVASVMLGETRALFENAARELGNDASVAGLAAIFERTGSVRLSA